jgi:hypothetical protein
MTLYELDELKKQLADGTLNLCGCLGAINGQPHCPCKMARLAKEEAEKCNIYEHDPFEADLINRPISKL